jgi:hypothetical protein
MVDQLIIGYKAGPFVYPKNAAACLPAQLPLGGASGSHFFEQTNWLETFRYGIMHIARGFRYWYFASAHAGWLE